jgi:putative spermidine/putrescine transport system substrate-binding protein
MRVMTAARTAALIGAVGLVLTACGGGTGGSAGGGTAPPGVQAYAGPVGQGEGKLSVLAWPGYAEDGSTDPKIDWVTPFEKATGCQVDVKTFGTSAEAVQLFQSGGYDVISASGDASLRLVYGNQVQPVNTGLVPNYADIFPDLKDKPWNSVGGKEYGIPHGRGANLILYNVAANPTPPTSMKILFDPSSPAKGKISPYDDAIYIADAAVYLKATQPDLGIKNPYALDQKQFDAAIALLKQQKTLASEYWSDSVKESQGLASGAISAGQGWQITANTANSDKQVVGSVKASEGATGWSDTWMVKKDTPNINCAYLWLNHIVSPQVNAQIAEYFGEAPANAKACDLTTDKNHCTTYHAADTAYWTDVYYWTTPTKQCLDGRTDTACVDYQGWKDAWTQLRSS